MDTSDVTSNTVDVEENILADAAVASLHSDDTPLTAPTTTATAGAGAGAGAGPYMYAPDEGNMVLPELTEPMATSYEARTYALQELKYMLYQHMGKKGSTLSSEPCSQLSAVMCNKFHGNASTVARCTLRDVLEALGEGSNWDHLSAAFHRMLNLQHATAPGDANRIKADLKAILVQLLPRDAHWMERPVWAKGLWRKHRRKPLQPWAQAIVDRDSWGATVAVHLQMWLKRLFCGCGRPWSHEKQKPSKASTSNSTRARTTFPPRRVLQQPPELFRRYRVLVKVNGDEQWVNACNGTATPHPSMRRAICDTNSPWLLG